MLRTISILGLLGLSACSFFPNLQEGPVSPDEQYLPTGGNAIDAGPQQKTLVQDLEEERIRVKHLHEQIGRLTSHNDELKAKLDASQKDFAKTSEAKSKSEHEAAELAVTVRNLKTKILMLQIENAQLEQAKVLMRIAALRTHQDALNATKAHAMPMSGANR